MTFLSHYEEKDVLADAAEGLSDDQDYNLGYILEWTSHRPVVAFLTWGADQGLESNPRFRDVHNIELTTAVAGYSHELQPDSLETALEVRNEIICRLSRLPLGREVDVEVHALLSGVGWADEYVKYFAWEEHSRQQG